MYENYEKTNLNLFRSDVESGEMNLHDQREELQVLKTCISETTDW